MAILKALKVTELSDLKSEAKKFGQHATDMHNKTNEMLKLIEDTSTIWKGVAREKYAKQFEGLRLDMDKLYNTCNEYSTDLESIASGYEGAENDNSATASKLKADVALV